MTEYWGSELEFTKMHGIGNDYIYFNCLEKELQNPEKVAQVITDRHFGVGGDGIVLICPSSSADFRMRMFNTDGSEAQNCGNAVRCVAKFIYDNGITNENIITLETLAGILRLEMTVDNKLVQSVRVDMGPPILEASTIPLNTTLTDSNVVTIDVESETFSAYCVSMGNPHAVIFVDEITDRLVLTLGPKIEHHPLFPERVNVEFVKVISPSELQMRVWERGTGETLACGTGASAVCVAGVQTGHSSPAVDIQLLGGTLNLHWDEQSNHVFMNGAAATAFHGTVNLEHYYKEE